ncbi:hypothetical protein C2S51_016838 [Perilla frutescens var. frutescens]|nr:hypothetical protein C2S51_016838 [Perilla frutescens var. frutescens]
MEGPIFEIFDFIRPHSPAVSVGQSIHWLTTKDVLTFDVKERCFRRFPLPRAVKDAYICKKLVKYEGGLGLNCLTEDWTSIELWVAERLGRGEWMRKIVVDMKFLVHIVSSR